MKNGNADDWNASGGLQKTAEDRRLFVSQCSVVNNLVKSSKLQYYTTVIKEHCGNQKQLYKTVNKLLQKPSTTHYPPSPDNRSIADVFADFFSAKIDGIQSDLLKKKNNIVNSDDITTDETIYSSSNFNTFSAVKPDDIMPIVMTTLSKSCALDPLPSSVIKPCVDLLLPVITDIVNQSLLGGSVPSSLKVAVLTPLLKKIWR